MAYVIDASGASLTQSPDDAGLAMALGHAHNAFMAAFEWYELVSDAGAFPGLAGERSRLFALIQTCAYLKELLDTYTKHRPRIVAWLAASGSTEASQLENDMNSLSDKKGENYKRLMMIRHKVGSHWDDGFFSAQVRRGQVDQVVRWCHLASTRNADLVVLPPQVVIRNLLAPGNTEKERVSSFGKLALFFSSAVSIVSDFLSTALAGYLLQFGAVKLQVADEDGLPSNRRDPR